MGMKKERRHINLVGKHTVGIKGAKAGARTKRLGRKRTMATIIRPGGGRPGGRP